MKIVLIGYGKMGRTVERMATDQGHEIIGHITKDTVSSRITELYHTSEVGIEFSHPDAALENILQGLDHGLPIVSGTTGWLSQLENVKMKVDETEGAFFYSSNFSIGVHIFWVINKHLAQLMKSHSEYDVSMEEVHHIHKKDKPSGTAITTADQIVHHLDRKSSWTLNSDSDSNEIIIQSIRRGEVCGTHHVNYTSPADTITLSHEAHTRDGFAHGAIIAAQWILDKQGMYSMDDLLKL